MPKLLLIATLFFLLGLLCVVTGMLGIFPVIVAQVGSALILLALALRVVSLFFK